MPREKFEYVERLGLYRKRIKDTDGKYVAIYGKTPTELSEKVKTARRAVEDNQTAKDNPTVSQYATEWLELYTAEMPRATFNVYDNAVRVHIVPVIGQFRIKDISPNSIKSVLVAMSGMSASMQSKTLNCMRKIFESAVDNDLISKNPCAKIKAGGKRTQEKEPLTEDQAQTLLDAVKGTRAEPFVQIGLYAGLRREEILGLRWDCVHLNGNAPHITVKRALRWEHNQPVVTEELKSAASKRTIPIPNQLVDYLRQIKGEPDSYVVGGAPLSQQQFRNLWRIVERREVGETTYRGENKEKVTFVRKKGEKSTSAAFRYTIDFEVTPHILRHTYITNLFLGGVDLKTVQYLAGHSDPQVTLKVYIHLMQNKPDDLIDKVNKAFEVKNEVKLNNNI